MVGDPLVSRRRRALRLVLGMLFSLVAAFAIGEGILQVAALFTKDRSEGWRPGAAHRILCVGDSHTYGALVEPSEAYPAQLQAFLDELAPGEFSVVNLGIPGINTGQLRSRLPVQVDRYRPDLVIAWAGINDVWNHSAENDDASGWTRIDALASRSRLYRLLRVFVHDLALGRDAATPDADPSRHQVDVERAGAKATFIVRAGGRVEHLQHESGAHRTPTEIEALAERDYASVALWARAAGVGLVFVSYPYQVAQFATVNRAMRRAAARYDVPVFESPPILGRIPQDQRRPLWGAHPPAPVYREIARDLAQLVLTRFRSGDTTSGAARPATRG